MHKLTYQFGADTTNSGRHLDAGFTLHLLNKSGRSGPNKYWIYRSTLKRKLQDRSLELVPNISLPKARELARYRSSG